MEKTMVDIVEDLNLEIMENFPEIQTELEYSPLSFSTDGSTEIVKFYGYQIWNIDDEEGRGYDEKTDTYEPMEPFLRRRINRFIELLSKIELKEE